MTYLFIRILNMSITTSYVVIFVMVARLLLKKAPKSFSYALWSVVLFRMFSPFALASPLSILIPLSSSGSNFQEYIPMDIGLMVTPKGNTNLEVIDKVINNSLPTTTPAASVNPMQFQMSMLSIVWIIGIIALVIYAVCSYIKIKRKVQFAVLLKDNIFVSDQIKTPFVLGMIKPRIYLPNGLRTGEMDYIINHEMTHIKRRDYLIKPLAFLGLTFHWFNPFVWASYFLMIKDMEMSCDEAVMRESDYDIRENYSTSMLNLSIRHSGLLIPLAFGESNIKSRIKNILNYKKPGFWIIGVAFILVLGMAIGLISNPLSSNSPEESSDLRAQEFLKTYYNVVDTDIADIFYNAIPEIISSQIDDKGNGISGIFSLEEEIKAKYGNLMTEEALESAAASRIITEGEFTAKEFGSSSEVNKVNLIYEEIKENGNIRYDFTVEVLVDFRDGKKEENIVLTGSIEVTEAEGEWKVREFRPNKGDFTRALTQGESYLNIVNNSNENIRTIEINTKGNSIGAMNADNTDIGQGVRFSFDMIDDSNLDFTVRLIDKDKKILIKRDFIGNFSEGKDMYLYIRQDENNNLIINHSGEID